MAATAFLLLAVVYLLIDVADFWSGSPLIYVGMNPILVSDPMALFSDELLNPESSPHLDRLKCYSSKK